MPTIAYIDNKPMIELITRKRFGAERARERSGGRRYLCVGRFAENCGRLAPIKDGVGGVGWAHRWLAL